MEEKHDGKNVILSLEEGRIGGYAGEDDVVEGGGRAIYEPDRQKACQCWEGHLSRVGEKISNWFSGPDRWVINTSFPALIPGPVAALASASPHSAPQGQ